mgnify:CR=1 FL=1
MNSCGLLPIAFRIVASVFFGIIENGKATTSLGVLIQSESATQ